MLYSPLVRAFSSISCRCAAITLISVLSSTPLIVSLLMGCPSVSRSTNCSKQAKSALASLILSEWKDTELSISANLPVAASAHEGSSFALVKVGNTQPFEVEVGKRLMRSLKVRSYKTVEKTVVTVRELLLKRVGRASEPIQSPAVSPQSWHSPSVWHVRP